MDEVSNNDKLRNAGYVQVTFTNNGYLIEIWQYDLPSGR